MLGLFLNPKGWYQQVGRLGGVEDAGLGCSWGWSETGDLSAFLHSFM